MTVWMMDFAHPQTPADGRRFVVISGSFGSRY
jgi:hypothetical protein